eukprot:jgi/Ulvmu1/7308/UM035_0097.1
MDPQGIPEGMMDHPYPSVFLKGYHEPVLGIIGICTIFFVAVFVLFTIAWECSPDLQGGEKWVFVWLVITSMIHMVVEGAYVLHQDAYTNKDHNMFLLELWKEYGKADSRYMVSDPFIVAVEQATSFGVGPLCLLTAGLVLFRSEWRWNALLLVSICQAYGTALYFMTSALENHMYTREEPLYLWFLFFFMNGLWIFVPGVCILYAFTKTARAVRAVENKPEKVAEKKDQ